MSIGNNIKRLRESKGMTQYALSKAIGVSQQSIDQWERSLSNPRKKNMDKIAVLFNVIPNELFGISSKLNEELPPASEDNSVYSEEDCIFLSRYKNLSPNVKKH